MQSASNQSRRMLITSILAATLCGLWAYYAGMHNMVETSDTLSVLMLNVIVGTLYFIAYGIKLEKNDALALLAEGASNLNHG